ncbi:unnamed protein product [Polarella glacialis]|uniref:START domain-containing protein n=2 Tax=Polarella glacialis TaxID=89957 RepID=A0A813GNQ8_POLGL|nr:unnamed protein product [Polarella glacialis]
MTSEMEAELWRVRRTGSKVLGLRQCLSTEAGWTQSISFAGIRCWHQQAQPGRGVVRVCAEAEVDAPLFDLLSIFYEVDFWHRWAPSFGHLGLKSAGLLGQKGPLRLVYWLEASLPWPFQHRVCRFAVEAVDCMSAGEQPQQIVILLDSQEAPSICPELLDAESPEWQGVLADVLDSGFILTPPEVGGTSGTKVQVLLNLDPKMVVPDWLVKYAAMNLCLLIFLQYRAAMRLARTPEFLERSCDPKHPFYSHIRKRMAESLPSQLEQAPAVRPEGCRNQQC